MIDSIFVNAMNAANSAFAAIAGETFEIPAGARLGVPGTYSAVNIDDLTAETAVAPGGSANEITLALFVKRSVIATAGIVESTILVVRGRRMRVGPVVDEGDSTLIINCKQATISLR